ncbi:MAG: hypothetical protein M1820_004796 [Bogoriella megaspora]|nr:MAG: hypothetical protein M1820_004796 [Bogoriella megaspora]
MTTLLLRPALRPLTATAFLSSTFLLAYALSPPQSRLLLCDTSPSPISPKDWSISQYQRDAQVPVVSRSGGLNARAVRQVSVGSIAGLATGLAISLFSKPLAVLLGLLVAGVQFVESRGIHIIPYQRLERWFKGIDVRTAVQDNVALKLSFGVTAALAGFGSF